MRLLPWCDILGTLSMVKRRDIAEVSDVVQRFGDGPVHHARIEGREVDRRDCELPRGEDLEGEAVHDGDGAHVVGGLESGPRRYRPRPTRRS